MATASYVEENWQTAKKSIRERNKFMFNNSLLSDIEFLPRGAPDAKGERRMNEAAIPAHKYVLAIGSPVFFAMFYGEIAETTDIVELPDCDTESFLELLRYLYYDEVELTGSNNKCHRWPFPVFCMLPLFIYHICILHFGIMLPRFHVSCFNYGICYCLDSVLFLVLFTLFEFCVSHAHSEIMLPRFHVSCVFYVI